MRPHYLDKAGKPIDLWEWAKLLEDHSYQVIKQETLPDGKYVSTVWLGLNHQYGSGPPLIFETMVFPTKGRLDEERCQRYSTLDDALAGHAEIVHELTKCSAE